MNTVSRAMVVLALLSAVVAFGRVASPDAGQAHSNSQTTTVATAAK